MTPHPDDYPDCGQVAVHRVPVKKRYVRGSNTDDTVTLTGVLLWPAPSRGQALLETGLLLQRRLIQTVDPRIAWDDAAFSYEGWRYIDFSFELSEEGEYDI